MLKKFISNLLPVACIILNSFAVACDNQEGIPGSGEKTKLTYDLPDQQDRHYLLHFDVEKDDQKSLNQWVARNGADIYRRLNNDPNFGYPGQNKYYTTSIYWYTTKIPWEHTVSLVKKRDVSASLALKDLLKNEGRFDCRLAQRIVFMECVRRLIGDNCFDEICAQFEKEQSKDILGIVDETKLLFLDGSINLNPYLRLASFDRGTLYRVSKVGYFGYSPNIEEYAILHPKGDLRGDHGLLCLGTDETMPHFAGCGAFYKQGPRSWDDMVVRYKHETITLFIPQEVIVDGSHIRADRRERYIKQMEAVYKAHLTMQKELRESLKDTYENQLRFLQYSFMGTVFYIDLEKVKPLLRASQQ